MDYIAFDLETTGLKPEDNRIVEIAAVRFRHYEPQESYVTLVDPGCEIPGDATRVSGITNDMVKGKPSIETVLPTFADFCGDTVLIAHNAPFDHGFLLQAVKSYQAPAPKGVVLDSCALSRVIFTGLPSYSLSTLIKHLNLGGGTFHRAEQDSVHCGLLFGHILKTLQRVNHACDIPALEGLTGKKALIFPHYQQSSQLGLF